MPDAPSGERFGKFVRTERLGAGGMGEVWKAWDTELARWVALKLLLGHDEDEIARFKREAQLAGKLTHPNIAAVYEVGEANGRHFIAMQYIDGRTLAAWKRADRRELLRHVLAAARAVSYAHSQGVIHRDLKPDNVMVDSAGRLYVMDFGLARTVQASSGLSQAGMVVGTPDYMSPEQAMGEPGDDRSDIFSLGATLYDLLVGRPPFRGEALVETLMKVASEDPVPPRRLDGTIDPDLQTVVLKCLEKDPPRRYLSMREAADDLERVLEGEPIAARPASVIYRLRKRFAKRRRSVIALGVAALLVVAALAALLRKSGELSESQRRLVARMSETSELSLKLALACRRAGDLAGMRDAAPRVESACREAQREVPSLAEPHYLWGRMLRAQMRFDEAFAEQERALQKRPDYGEARYERGLLLVRRYEERLRALRSRRRMEEGDVSMRGTAAIEPPASEVEDDAARVLKRQALDDLKRVDRSVARGLAALIEGDRAAAKAHFERAAQETPDAEEAYELRARVAREAGDLEDAEKWCTLGLERDRGYLPHLEERAFVRRLRDVEAGYAAAVADLDTVLGLDPSRAPAWRARGMTGINLAWCLRERKADPTEAYAQSIADLTEAARLDASDALAIRLRAQARANLGRWKQSRGEDATGDLKAAVADYAAALRMQPADAQGWLLAASVQLNLAEGAADPAEHFERALKDSAEAVRVGRSTAGAWMIRGTAHYNYGNWRGTKGDDPSELYREAAADFTKALALEPASPQYVQLRGLARMGLAKAAARRSQDARPLFKDALADLEEAVKRAPALEKDLARWIEECRRRSAP